jgi:hypothetical protein
MADKVDVAAMANMVESFRALLATSKQTSADIKVAETVATARTLEQAAKALDEMPFDTLRKKAKSVADSLSAAPPKLDDASAALKEIAALIINDPISANASLVETNTSGSSGALITAKTAADDTDKETGTKDKNIDLGEFFRNVSSSLIEAQAALNKSSLQYVSTLDPRFPPAYYGIPSVKAEMRVGFQDIKDKGINLILIKDTTTKNQYAESTVSFEVVGTPPPPGPATYGDYVVPVPRFLVVEPQRSELLDRLKSETGAKLPDKYTTTQPYAMVLRYESSQDIPGAGLTANDSIKRYLVLWPGLLKKNENPMPHAGWIEFSVMYVEEDETGKLSLPAPTNPDPNKLKVPPDPGFSIFEFIPRKQAGAVIPYADGVFTIPLSTKETLATKTKDELAMMIVNLGDTLLNVIVVFYQWLEDVKYRTQQL